MSLSERLKTDLAEAMKARETTRVSVIRLLKSAIQNKEIEVGGSLSTEQENQLRLLITAG